MKEVDFNFSKSDLYGALVTYNADPYTAEDEQEVEELYNDLQDSTIMLLDESDGEDYVDACEKLDIDQADASDWKIYKTDYPGGLLFAVN